MWWLMAGRVLIGLLMFGIIGGLIALFTGFGGLFGMARFLQWLDDRQQRQYLRLPGPCALTNPLPPSGTRFCTRHRARYPHEGVNHG